MHHHWNPAVLSTTMVTCTNLIEQTDSALLTIVRIYKLYLLKNYLQTCMLCGHYITVCPQNCQTSCKPLWTDIYPTDIVSQWQDERKLALVVNLADEPTVWQPGFNLPINCWALLNRFWTNHNNCTSC